MRLLPVKRVRGLSLIEVVLASILFATVVGGLAVTWGYHERSLKKYRTRNAARVILTQEMERMTAYNYENLDLAQRTVAVPLIRSVDGAETRLEYQVVTTVTENAELSLKDIQVSVTFPDQGVDRTLTIRTRSFLSQ